MAAALGDDRLPLGRRRLFSGDRKPCPVSSRWAASIWSAIWWRSAPELAAAGQWPAPLQRALAAGLLLAIWSAGFWLQSVNWTEPVGKPYRVALAQGDIAQVLKWDPAAFEQT
jgi:apolipoprotein N-acyltransferase